MKILYALAAFLLLHTCSVQVTAWDWESDKKPEAPKQIEEQSNLEYEIQGSSSDYSEQAVQYNNTEQIEKIVDNILVSTREGRNLEGYDEVYSDPNVQEAIQKGDDGEARNIIKERLCNLGLMQCDEGVEGKRPYISPEELIYAQPVAINPVGQPIPTIPVKGGRGYYGPPKPMPYPGKFGPPGPNKFGPPPPKFGPPPTKFGPPSPPNKFGPGPTNFAPNKPPRRGYGPPPVGKPIYSKPPFETYDDGHEFVKPGSFDDIPYEFDPSSFNSFIQKDKVQQVILGDKKEKVEHIHHHYHHNLEGSNKAPTVIVNPVPVAAAAAASASEAVLNSQSSFGSFGTNAVHHTQTSAFNPATNPGLGGAPLEQSSFSGSSGFTGINTGFSSVKPGLTIGGSGFNSFSGSGLNGGSYGGQSIANYGSSVGGGLGSFQQSVKPVTENFGAQSFGGNSFGASVGSYGSSGLYKKELSLSSGNSNYLQSSYADKYQGLESARAENYDCVCVPYDQCPSHDVIGRKDDLLLPLDPRNLKSDIAAEEERVITDGNGTMSVIRVPKDVSKNATVTVEEKSEEKKISKREAPVQKKEEKAEAVSIQFIIPDQISIKCYIKTNVSN